MSARCTRRVSDEYTKSLFNVAVGRSVRALRDAAGMSQRELCEAARVSAPMLVNIENGAIALPLFAASSIAEALDCTLDDICPVMISEPQES